jgi:hypothetical protein
MAQIDEIKEDINFLKLWLSILIMNWVGISHIGKTSNLLLLLVKKIKKLKDS